MLGEVTSRPLECPGDVIVLPAPDERWIVMNVFARTCVALDGAGLSLMRSITAGRHGDETARLWDIEVFSNLDGLLADPSRFIRNSNDWPECEIIDQGQLAKRLLRHCILIDDETEYRARFGPKKNVLDRKHFGNFHEQMGQQLMLNKRVMPEEWWVTQKFNDDVTALRDSLYGAIQGFALPRYFERRFGDGVHVIDIGCGPGYFANLVAETGATVLGVDPNEGYIDGAKKRAHGNARFEVMDVGSEGGCAAVPDASADFVFMSDALLFYFVSHDAGSHHEIEHLFADIRRILKPGGQLISLEPHFVFWLNPWLGDIDRPFTVLSGYHRSSFRVTETLSGLVQAFANGGFSITWMEELYPDPQFESADPRAYHFAAQFPLWHLFELTPVERGHAGS